jgi:DNA-binding transcriptional MerR regulator
MSNRILTLFGEEVAPEEIKAVGKSRAKKKTEEPSKAEEKPAEETAVVPEVKEEKKFELPDDWDGDKKYYSIGEVATLFKVKTSHIRFWTNEFKLKVRTTRKGDRLYTPEQVRELKAIHHLVKERGFTLTGAKAKLKTQNNRDVETIDLKHALLALRNKLLIIRNQISAPPQTPSP